MTEHLSEAIISTFESGKIPPELLGLSQRQDPADLAVLESRTHYLGPMAGLEWVYKSCSPEAQEKFRSGVKDGVRQYRENNLELDTVGGLIILAGYTKNYGAVPDVVSIVDKLGQSSDFDYKNSRLLLGASLSLLVDFALEGDNEAKQFAIDHLKSWFENPAFERLAASIMNGVCEINPEDFPNYFPRFLKVAREHPEYFLLDGCIRESVRVVTPERMRQLLGSLPEDGRELVQKFLN